MMLEYYKNDKDFREYVDKYCEHYKCTVEEALTRAIVIEVYNDYSQRQPN